MALEEKSGIDLITVTESGHIEVRRADVVLRDGVEVAKTYHRHVLAPGDDLAGQDPRVAAVAQAVWTDDVVQQYRDSQPINQGELA